MVELIWAPDTNRFIKTTHVEIHLSHIGGHLTRGKNIFSAKKVLDPSCWSVVFVKMEKLKWWTNERRRTLLMVSLACILGEADEALLPGVYREISLALHVSPVGLGTLTLIRSLSQAICSPLAAYAAVHHNRASVIALGALLWALATYFTGFSTSYGQVWLILLVILFLNLLYHHESSKVDGAKTVISSAKCIYYYWIDKVLNVSKLSEDSNTTKYALFEFCVQML